MIATMTQKPGKQYLEEPIPLICSFYFEQIMLYPGNFLYYPFGEPHETFWH
jgi:hypothetical protein